MVPSILYVTLARPRWTGARRSFSIFLLALGFAAGLQAQRLCLSFGDEPRPTDSATLESLPSIGLWMIAGSGDIAHWLGAKSEGRTIQEPINIIIVDSLSTSEREALDRLNTACKKSEFERRPGHSDGYSAYIGGELYPQFPRKKSSAYSDGPFEFPNDHGRLFGPAPWGSSYVFVGAFSREYTNLAHRVMHQLSSFDQARDAFARALVRSGRYEIAGFVPLGNAIVDSSRYTTGDHDGIAVLLDAISGPEKNGATKPFFNQSTALTPAPAQNAPTLPEPQKSKEPSSAATASGTAAAVTTAPEARAEAGGTETSAAEAGSNAE